MMFEGWGEFYILVGGASAALIGLLFVVTTLATEMHAPREQVEQGATSYMTPTLFHYTTVLVMSALATIPAIPVWAYVPVLGAWSAAGAIYCSVIALRIRQQRLPDSGHLGDVLGYGAVPALVYAGLFSCALFLWRGNGSAVYGIAAGLILLTVLGIRNSWDLVMFIAPRSVEPREDM